jgi:hypothetical protein
MSTYPAFPIRRLILPVGSLLLLCSSALALGQSSATGTQAKREQYLQKLEQILPPVPSWTEWQQKTGALPPDFDSLPKQNELPDPLTFLNGKKVRTAADWDARRREIQQLSERYEWGTIPPRPTITRTVVVDEKHEDGYTIRNLSALP